MKMRQKKVDGKVEIREKPHMTQILSTLLEPLRYLKKTIISENSEKLADKAKMCLFNNLIRTSSSKADLNATNVKKLDYCNF